jgi:tetratricopeptide (TPR) repeat protein
MSLPLAFGTRLETIPAEVPYLAVPEPARRHWAERLEAAAPGRLRIGIAWAGRKGHQYDARRSLAFERLLPLMQDPRVCWVNLQKWAPEDSRPDIPASLDWLDWTDELADFADTAALVANLDLVISIDSALVHLAGGLDVPVWMLDRFDNEWRWLHHREDSPWYPSLRIFRQRAFGAWEEVIDRVRAALADLPAPRAILPPTPRPARLAPKVGAGATALPRESLPQNSLSPLPEANLLHQQGIAAWQAGQKEHALRLIEQAIACDGRVALFHSNLAEMNRQLGRLDAAIRHGRQAVALDPTLASAHSNLGIALYDAKRYDEAEACHRQALALEPDLLQSLNNLGSIARARKDRKTAAGWYRQALARDPDYLEALSNLGAVLVEDDEADAAAPSLERALQLQPAYPEALCNLGLVRIKQERMEEAAGLLQHSLQLRPGYPEALVGLARVMQEKDDLAQAERLLRQAVAVAPDKVDAWCQLGSVCMEQGEAEAAEAAYMKALEIDPEMSDALAGLGNLRLEQGKIDEAEAILKQAIALKPDNLGARFHLTQVKKVRPGDENLAALEARLTEIDRLSRDKRISLHYALGKAYDDLAEYDKAFPHFLEGARLKRSTIAYDPEAEAERIRRLMAICDRRYFEARRGAGAPSDVPVFVLGMPRSGTTLTEQIIASHPQVFGAGELSDLLTLIQQPIEGLSFPENLAALTSETLTQWGREYVARLRRRAPQALRITDKMPANYLALGLIPLMLPNARIIHVRRNPLDTCLSCFTRLFNRGQEATYDLYELGRHYANYARLMNHWRTALPPESFLEVVYEDIVADLEGQARRLIDWVGLEWDERCLAFHENRRSIRTTSVTQVRQPIYTSSVERWRHYEKYLGPLMAGLGEFAPGKG